MRVLNWSDERTILAFYDVDALEQVLSMVPKNRKRFIIDAEGWEDDLFILQGHVIEV